VSDPVPLRPRKPCPVCKKPSQPKFHPFCSSRCADIDLGRWFGGHYAIKSEDDSPADSVVQENEGDANSV
jgi:uncharacterized protein